MVTLPKYGIIIIREDRKRGSTMPPIIIQLLEAMQAQADPTIAKSTQRFFKEGIKCYGLKSATTRKLAKQFGKEIKTLSKAKIFALCETLWQTGYMEACSIACEWAYAQHEAFTPDDITIFEHWIQSYVNNWASCDSLCNHNVGDFVMMYPEHIATLQKWAETDHPWLKRAAAVSLIIPARRGLFLPEIFQIATTLMHDPADLVQKGYGWMLKAASEAHQQAVFDYLMQHKHEMPRTAFRYALEKMPQELKARCMEK
jgi:3-methyladenine DNA glycosylase AlkD